MPRILIVDDNEDNRDVLARRLQRRGFDVTCAAGGKQGVEQASHDNPDVILMDMNMPELDGWDATKQIRQQGLTVPVIALTAHAMAGDRQRALDAGCNEYHTKPVELDKLLDLIENLLSTPQ
ncbi:response regulator [Roseimaritima ulvae]|uniref:Alkaline phosphatase synthesis transcriptional regulatory protein PhoP n=1 Tax=Roseimaritima ulvae TaxID=980254 RepID=A0A5B9QSC8_9BACT|nr:response regulator [Roseimaritima ulvae]QEG42017.1 Alkaline phosphatase synthesis transcriptional regulatory protein PhoP [Roseimaritima ulvae]